MTDVIVRIAKAATEAVKPVVLSRRLYDMGIRNDEGGPISQSSLYAWAAGRQRPTSDKLLALALVAGVKVDAFLYPTADPWEDRFRKLEDRMDRLDGGGDVKQQ